MTREEIGLVSESMHLRSGAGSAINQAHHAAHGEHAEHGGHGAHETSDTVSMVGEHRGHRIVIEVRYRFIVDDQPLATPLTLDADGVLGSHALPQYAFRSPMDLVKALIDNFDAKA